MSLSSPAHVITSTPRAGQRTQSMRSGDVTRGRPIQKGWNFLPTAKTPCACDKQKGICKRLRSKLCCSISRAACLEITQMKTNKQFSRTTFFSCTDLTFQIITNKINRYNSLKLDNFVNILIVWYNLLNQHERKGWMTDTGLPQATILFLLLPLF